jgi:hypothetical protein
MQASVGRSCARQHQRQANQRPIVSTHAIKSSGAKQVVCSKTIVAKPAEVERVAAVLGEILTYSEERAKDKASGIQSMQVVRDQFDNNVFHCYER